MESQEAIARGLASRNEWNVLEVFDEPYSGRKDRRPLIDEIVVFIKRSPKPVHHCIIKGIDRFTRAGYVEYQKLKDRIESLGVNVVDSYGLIQPKQNTLEHLGVSYDWSEYSPSEAAEMLEAHRGRQEVRDILTRMIGAQIQLVRDGYKVARPADGYLNQRIEVGGKKRYIEVPDPDRADYFREMFRLRARGGLTDPQIVKRINKMGYHSKSTKRWNRAKSKVIGHTRPKPLTVKRFQSIIRKPIYCGVIVWKWTDGKPVRAQYEGLVSIETFNRANRGDLAIVERPDGTLSLERGGNSTRKRLKNNPTYPYKNVVFCPACGDKPLLGSASRGKMGKTYPAYHCNRGHYLRYPKAPFDEVVDRCLVELRLKKGFREALRESLHEAFDERRDEVQTQIRLADEQRRRLKIEQESALEALIAATQPSVREKLEARIEDLERQIEELTEEDSDEVNGSQIDRFVDQVCELMEHPLRHLKDPYNVERQQELWNLVFDQPPTYDQIANGTPSLSLVFKLNRDFEDLWSLKVRVRGFRWNFWRRELLRWRVSGLPSGERHSYRMHLFRRRRKASVSATELASSASED